MKKRGSSDPAVIAASQDLLPAIVGLWLGVTLVKFGNPVILDSRIDTPRSFLELVYQPWPVAWGYVFLIATLLVSLPFWTWRDRIPIGLKLLPLIWLGWQLVSATQTVDSSLTAATVPHFTACVIAFYLGLFSLSRVPRLQFIWLGIACGWLIVVVIGWQQHFGGLKELREFFYSQPDWQAQSADFIRKLGSERIYSTLIYPNALAGALLIVTPPLAGAAYQALKSQSAWIRWPIVLSMVSGAAACLFWTGSKGGWLIAVAISCVGIFRATRTRNFKRIAVLGIVAAGLIGFWVRHAAYFDKGATSARARVDYWRAAVAGFKERPILGSGPGTFVAVYRQLKHPDAEMTRLAHNDYLQQATDSGLIGFFAYTAFILGSILYLYRNRQVEGSEAAVRLGLVAGALHGLLEFGLYIPALAWPFFLILGTSLGRSQTAKSVDNENRPHYGLRHRL